jgi:PKD repeat protein
LSLPAARIAALVLAAPLLLASSALAAPSGTFTFSPAPPDRPNAGETVQFTTANVVFDGASGTGTVAFGYGDGNLGDVASHAYAAPGSYKVDLILTNSEAGSTPTLADSKTVVVNAPPTVVFSEYLPIAPLPGQDVLFTSDSSDPDGDPIAHLWDFGGGVTSPNRNAVHAFSSAGVKQVTLTVTDPFGASDTKTQDVGVLAASGPVDQPPRAGFAFSPRTPEVGDSVEFVSSSSDPEDKLREQTWDLDGDGEFDDARGDEIVSTYTSAGQKRVRLRVEDAAGNAAVRERELTVKPGPVARAGFLSPAPIVRLAGTILSSGFQVRVLSVRAPRGALVVVKCSGRGCKVERRRKRVKSGSVRFKTYERYLQAGIKLGIFIRKPNTIGSYTRLTIRAGRAPVRLTRCLEPGASKPKRRCG